MKNELVLTCRHCFWFSKKGRIIKKSKNFDASKSNRSKSSCSDDGVLKTTKICKNFEPDYFNCPVNVRKLVHVMGQIKDSDLPLAKFYMENQRRINRNKKLKILPYKVGDTVWVRYTSDKYYKIIIHHINEEHVYGETTVTKIHCMILHKHVYTKKPEVK